MLFVATVLISADDGRTVTLRSLPMSVGISRLLRFRFTGPSKAASVNACPLAVGIATDLQNFYGKKGLFPLLGKLQCSYQRSLRWCIDYCQLPTTACVFLSIEPPTKLAVLCSF